MNDPITLLGGPADGATIPRPPRIAATCRSAWAWSRDRKRLAWYVESDDPDVLRFSEWITPAEARRRFIAIEQKHDHVLAGEVWA